MQNIIWYCLSVFFLSGCVSSVNHSSTDPQPIVDQAIAAHGGDKFLHAEISFSFRDRKYLSLRDNGHFQFERIFIENGDSIRDVLSNEGFFREVNGQRVAIPDSMALKYSNSVNSVIYFAVLPFGLNDPAVQKSYLGEVEIKAVPYHKIKVTFGQDGGGVDFEDEFVYWFRTDNFRMDYLAYLYHTEGGGMRFRKAYNTRTIGGLVISDYVNYEADPRQYRVEQTDSLFEAQSLKELSVIELQSVSVK
ncbi:MAG: DUF6503 family protein [Bacteroidia bacterium]